MSRGLVFDCDGVLMEGTEHIHLKAFNRMWREFSVPWEWSVEEYGRMLCVSGGKERLMQLFHNASFRSKVGVSNDPETWMPLVRRWHERKTEIYIEKLAATPLPVRPGITRLATAALEAGWSLGVASAGAYEAVVSTLEQTFGTELASRFTVVSGNMVTAKKPAPDVYLETARRMGINARFCVAVEDSPSGAIAAVSAGMECVAVPTMWTSHMVFPEGVSVVTSLGDPVSYETFDGNAAMDAHKQRGQLPFIDLRDLEAMLYGAETAAFRALRIPSLIS